MPDPTQPTTPQPAPAAAPAAAPAELPYKVYEGEVFEHIDGAMGKLSTVAAEEKTLLAALGRQAAENGSDKATFDKLTAAVKHVLKAEQDEALKGLESVPLKDKPAGALKGIASRIMGADKYVHDKQGFIGAGAELTEGRAKSVLERAVAHIRTTEPNFAFDVDPLLANGSTFKAHLTEANKGFAGHVKEAIETTRTSIQGKLQSVYQEALGWASRVSHDTSARWGEKGKAGINAAGEAVKGGKFGMVAGGAALGTAAIYFGGAPLVMDIVGRTNPETGETERSFGKAVVHTGVLAGLASLGSKVITGKFIPGMRI